jgi:hypothetical protein
MSGICCQVPANNFPLYTRRDPRHIPIYASSPSVYLERTLDSVRVATLFTPSTPLQARTDLRFSSTIAVRSYSCSSVSPVTDHQLRPSQLGVSALRTKCELVRPTPRPEDPLGLENREAGPGPGRFCSRLLRIRSYSAHVLGVWLDSHENKAFKTIFLP